jgi:hypothetical protein
MRSFRALQSDVVRLNTLITEKKGIQQQLLQETAGAGTASVCERRRLCLCLLACSLIV